MTESATANTAIIATLVKTAVEYLPGAAYATRSLKLRRGELARKDIE